MGQLRPGPGRPDSKSQNRRRAALKMQRDLANISQRIVASESILAHIDPDVGSWPMVLPTKRARELGLVCRRKQRGHIRACVKQLQAFQAESTNRRLEFLDGRCHNGYHGPCAGRQVKEELGKFQGEVANQLKAGRTPKPAVSWKVGWRSSGH